MILSRDAGVQVVKNSMVGCVRMHHYRRAICFSRQSFLERVLSDWGVSVFWEWGRTVCAYRSQIFDERVTCSDILMGAQDRKCVAQSEKFKHLMSTASGADTCVHCRRSSTSTSSTAQPGCAARRRSSKAQACCVRLSGSSF